MKFVTVLTLSLMTAYSNGHFTFQPVDGDTPMILTQLARAHVSFDSFKLLFYIDLGQYYKLTDTITASIESLKAVTSRVNSAALNITLGQLQHRLNLLSLDEEFISAFRSKRFVLCEFCGRMEHWLYGTMTEDSAKQWLDTLNSWKDQIITNHDLISNQTDILESSLKYNKETFEHIEQSFNSITKILNVRDNATQFEIRNINTRMDANNLVQITQLAVDEHQRMYDQIRRTLSDARRGKIPELISKSQLAEELNRISNSLRITQRLPINTISENALHIFKFSKISSSLFDRKLMMEIEIPLAEREEFSLYKATPVPVVTKSGPLIAAPYSAYFLLNSETTKYVKMTQNQLQAGQMLANNEMLYRPTTAVLLDSSRICEWKILTTHNIDEITDACHFTSYTAHNTLITILENDVYFNPAYNTTHLWEKCGKGEYVSRQIEGRGTIQLDHDCSIKSQTFMIMAHKTNRINATRIIQPKISTNDIPVSKMHSLIHTDYNVSVPLFDHPIIIHDAEDMNNLIKTAGDIANKAKQEVKLEELKVDATNMSIFSGLLSSLILIGSVILIAYIIFVRINLFACLMNVILGKSTSVSQDETGCVVINLEQPAQHSSARKEILHTHRND